MNKRLKKMIATISTVAMCATSVISMSAGAIAIFPCEEVTPYTTSFSIGDEKYHLWQKATDYFGLDNLNIYIDETNSSVMAYYQEVAPFVIDKYKLYNEEDIATLESYLSNNGIEYSVENFVSVFSDVSVGIKINPEVASIDEYYDIFIKIKEDTGFIVDWFMLTSAVGITDIEMTLPEPTILGDANEDGKVTIADAVLIMQALSNPNDFQLTPQGIANADMVGDGDGVTVMDALRIQEMEINM